MHSTFMLVQLSLVFNLAFVIPTASKLNPVSSSGGNNPSIGPTKSVAVKGILKCGNSTAHDVKVQLLRIKSDDANEIMERRTSGPAGMFEINANTAARAQDQNELTNPVIRIQHQCDLTDSDKKKNRVRQLQINVPSDFVVQGRIARKTFDVGTLNLELKYPKEINQKV